MQKLCTHTVFSGCKSLSDVDNRSTLKLMHAVLDTWEVGMHEHPTTNASQSCVLLKLAHHFSSLARLWMESFQTDNGYKFGLEPLLEPEKKAQELTAMHAHFHKNVQQVLRKLVSLVSCFALQAGNTGMFSGTNHVFTRCLRVHYISF